MSMDNYDMFCLHESEQSARSQRLPKCAECEEPIYDDELFDIDGIIYCVQCAENKFLKFTDEYTKENY